MKPNFESLNRAVGLGVGLVLPTTIDTALGAVSQESSGVSSGVQLLRANPAGLGVGMKRALVLIALAAGVAGGSTLADV